MTAPPTGRADRRSTALALLFAPLLATAQAAPARAADPVFPPAASVGLAPPAGMTPSRNFAGFEHASGASIVIAEMPAEAYPELVARFTPEALRATGFAARGPGEALPVAGGEGRILRGTQSANGLGYAKWVALVRGGAGGTGLVTVQVPERASRQVPGAAVEAALRTIAFRAPASLADQMASLPYAVGDLGGFRPVRVFMGNGLLLTDGPKDVDPEHAQAFVVVSPSLGEVAVAPGREGEVARRTLLGGLPQLRDLAVTDEARETRGAAVVVRLRGTASEARSGRPVGVVQAMVFEGTRAVRALGVTAAGVASGSASPADGADALARLERVTASIALR